MNDRAPMKGSAMSESAVRDFWNAHPCGDHIVGGLHGDFRDDHERFFAAYDAWRYDQEAHIPACLDRFDFRDRRVLEIGLGQGAESEQLIRRGARWSGLDLTEESVERVRTRLALRSLPHVDLRQGSACAIPWPDSSFDVVFSHGVLHHVPDIATAQAEIHRVLRPGGTLVAMLYARHSLNYQVSIRVLRRAILAAAYPLRRTRLLRDAPQILRAHLANAERVGLRRYLEIEEFTHRSTDGPHNPHARVYSRAEVVADFPSFELVGSFQRYLHAPPLPVRRLPLADRLGWHLWVELRARSGGGDGGRDG
jgi:SAM-dependent methyltransferase